MWSAVTPRFRRFITNLQLSEAQRFDGLSKARNVARKLNSEYFGDPDLGLGYYVYGSWGKGTAISPPYDVDMYYRVPIEEFERFDRYAGNGQSGLLASVRETLLDRYPQTRIRGDGQVVVIDFNSLTIEVAPCLERQNGSFLIPNSNQGGAWMVAEPRSEISQLNYVDSISNNNLRPLVQMAKQWKRHCNVPIKSFYIELLATEYMRSCEWREQSLYYYDWIVRDFFQFLVNSPEKIVSVPYTEEIINVGSDWHSRSITAWERAVSACEFEREDSIWSAGECWQRIFGDKIPEYAA
ncbi:MULTISPECIES: nucleotidyltransferase [unclassified Hyphomonas]|uniref:SMODS domain-containing nucleotidyltransferase n=1 Tax=unclassified Hyphomonas TaxID=2630699 RepID=UPI00054E6FE9|nr:MULTISPECIES: nucleotidyltransferase [unclassified Hyphomonas]